MQHRLERLRERLTTQQLDGLLVTSAANRRYLSGFTGSAGALLVTGEHAVLLSDGRYAIQGPQEAPAFEFVLLSDDAPLSKQLAELVNQQRIQRLGFEANDLNVAQYTKLQLDLQKAEVQSTWVATEHLVEGLREVKDDDEIATLRRAIAITDDALAAVRPMLRPAMREREVAWELEKAMRERGAEAMAFEVIVASGDNGSRPHARASDTQLGVGRPIVLDFGARLAGYHADMTRTIILGEADQQFWQVYNTVLQALETATAGARVGMTGALVDARARDVIATAGYGEAFGHGLGHGVGLQVHEGPAVRRLSQAILPAGAIFSVEPGIYLPGWGGVRIEDLVLLTGRGAETLTQSPKDPVVEI